MVFIDLDLEILICLRHSLYMVQPSFVTFITAHFMLTMCIYRVSIDTLVDLKDFWCPKKYTEEPTDIKWVYHFFASIFDSQYFIGNLLFIHKCLFFFL